MQAPHQWSLSGPSRHFTPGMVQGCIGSRSTSRCGPRDPCEPPRDQGIMLKSLGTLWPRRGRGQVWRGDVSPASVTSLGLQPWQGPCGRVSGLSLRHPLFTSEMFVSGAQFQVVWGSATSAASTPPTEVHQAARWPPAGRKRAPSMAPRSGSRRGTRGPLAPLQAAMALVMPMGASSPTGGNCSLRALWEPPGGSWESNRVQG